MEKIEKYDLSAVKLQPLKSGTDFRGTALDIRGSRVNLGPNEAYAASLAFASIMREKGGRRIALGCDPRLSSPLLKKAAADGLVAGGCTVLDMGMCSTPSTFMMTKLSPSADGAVMITASHHPADKNGLKFFTKEGGIEHSELDEIARRGENFPAPAPGSGSIEHADFLGIYCEFLRKVVCDSLGGERPLQGMKIAVDAGNGAGGFYVRRVLEPLGADCSGSCLLDPDGSFPAHVPNPEDPAAMRSISRATTSSRSDLGIVFDTDVDRAAVVSKSGEEINRNRLIALCSAIVLRDCPGATIVTDSVTSAGLTRFIEAHGGVHHRFRRGYKNVIDEAIRLEKSGTAAPLAIETSGHAALKENYFLDDGAYLVTKLITEAVRAAKSGGTLDGLIADLPEPAEEGECRLSFRTPDFKTCGEKIIEDVKNTTNPRLVPAKVNYEGVLVSVPAEQGRFLIRMSVHDPIMPINIESDRAGGVKRIAGIVLSLLEKYDCLETDNLKKLV